MNIPHIGEHAAPARSAAPILQFFIAAGSAGNYLRFRMFFVARLTLQAGSAAQQPTGGCNG